MRIADYRARDVWVRENECVGVRAGEGDYRATDPAGYTSDLLVSRATLLFGIGARMVGG